jgi:hypothetical protein
MSSIDPLAKWYENLSSFVFEARALPMTVSAYVRTFKTRLLFTQPLDPRWLIAAHAYNNDKKPTCFNREYA